MNYPSQQRTPKGNLYGLNWYFTCKEWYLTDRVPNDHIVIHQNHTGLKKGFSSCTADKLLTLIDKNRGVYEMITRFPCKFYADIDFHNPPQDFNQKEYVANLIEAFSYFMPEIRFAVSGSVTNEKASFHFVAQNYTINNEEERSMAKLIAKKICECDDEGVDWKVYTQGRQMKCINQSKPNKPVQMPITYLDNPKAHLITCFIEGTQKPIPSYENLTIPKKEQLNRVREIVTTYEPLLELPNPEGITWEELLLPENKLKLLNMIPLTKEFSHSHTSMVMNWCICNQIPQDSFLKWLEGKSDSAEEMMERRDKYAKIHWPYLQTKIEKCEDPATDYQYYRSQRSMRHQLLQWYPNLRPEDAHSSEFKKYLQPEGVIIEDTIDPLVLNYYNDKKFVCLGQPMGAGKTTAELSWIRQQVMDGKSAVYITHRTSVALDIKTRLDKELEDYGVNTLVRHYKEGGAAHIRKKMFQSAQETQILIITINSLHMIKGRDIPFDIIVMDEWESMMNGLCQVSKDKLTGRGFFTTDDKKKAIDTLSEAIRSASKVFSLDAFPTVRYTNFMKMHMSEGDESVILDMPPPDEPPRKLIQVKDEEKMIEKIVKSIKADKTVFVSYPYKSKMQVFVGWITHYLMKDPVWKERGFKQGENYQFYHADVDSKVKKQLGDVNKNWEGLNLILTNTVLTAGVSYTNHVDEVYLLAASFSNARDLIQVSMRCRNLESKNIFYCNLPSMPINAWQNDASQVNKRVYTQLMNDTTIEMKVDINTGLLAFANKAHWDINDPITEKGKLKAFKQVIEDCKHKCSQLEWDNIDDITQQDAELLELSHLRYDNATAMERRLLHKHYYKMQFITDTDENLIKHIWNNGLMAVVKACNDAYRDPNSFEGILNKYNEWTNFPYIEGETDASHWKPEVPTEAKDTINKHFVLRYDETGKRNANLLRTIYNTKYGIEIIRRKKKNKRYYYSTPNTDELNNLCEKALPQLNIPQDPQVCLLNVGGSP